MKKVLFITNIPSPYRVKFFEELGKKCVLTVVFETEMSSERDSSWRIDVFRNFKAIFCNGLKVGTDHSLTLKPIKIIKHERFDEIVITNNVSLTGLLEVLYLKRNKIPYIIEGDGSFCRDKELFVKRFFKTLVIKGAKEYYSTCNNHDEYYLMYGARRKAIIRYPFSSVSNIDVENVTMEEKRIIRKKLDINEHKVIVSIGQFIYRKGFDVLIRSMQCVNDEIGVYILGGYNLPFEVSDDRIHIKGFLPPCERDEYIKAADLFVFPTREDIWGLVVNEAMAKGVPVISTDRCNAALEMINDNQNGYIIPANDSEALSDRIKDFFELSEEDRREISKNSYETAKKWTIEEMVSAHKDIVD